MAKITIIAFFLYRLTFNTGGGADIGNRRSPLPQNLKISDIRRLHFILKIFKQHTASPLFSENTPIP